MKIKFLLFTIFFALFSSYNADAQSYRIQNGIGLYGGLTSFDIDTDDFATERQNGWLAGMAATVDLPHRWYDVSYNIQLSENQLGIAAIPIGGSQAEMIDYKLFTAQVALIGHLKVIKNYITIDAGPQLQYNSNLDLQDDTKENFLVDGYNTITAKDISEISRFNVNATVGATFGVEQFKLRAQYIYGFTNILGKLNDKNLSENSDFKGNQSMLVFSAGFFF
ncbi:hypothetical protein ACFQ1Q_05020 [Winogradskyella litorisediminis]|uniref:Outer membrane protein beta-barrel domain-containing protein n=1 Tax=Winogradskyella litorisediminis TaxID=1156618 RepID=A0ABW3N822_9FLAO